MTCRGRGHEQCCRHRRYGGIGREFARTRAERGDEVVLTGRDAHRTDTAAKEIGAHGLALDLSRPREIAGALAGVERVDHLVLAGISRDQNTVTDYDIDAALHLVTLKLVGYTEAVHTLLPRMTEESAVVIFGGQAKERPYPGATTVATVNAGVTGLVRTLASELAPIRVNAVHPGIVGDSPFWAGKPRRCWRTTAPRRPRDGSPACGTSWTRWSSCCATRRSTAST